MTLFATGFRPFFLAAAATASVALPVWAAVLAGRVPLAGPLLGTHWHAHEMLLGFTAAVLAGFFLTAVQNWTRDVTATGTALAALVALWGLGRVAAAVDLGPLGLAADVAFLPTLAAVIGRPLIRAGSRRNLAFVPLLVLLGGIDLAGHLGALPASVAMGLILDGIVVILAIVGGRIVPLFTRNALPHSGARKVPAVDRAALAAVWALLAVDLVASVVPLGPVPAAVALAAGLLHAVRMATWGTFATLRAPILWVLHLGYAWIAAGLLLRGAIGLGAGLPPSTATHALTVGAIGTLTLGMMSRVALGHTGRRLAVGRLVVVAYGLVTGAAAIRVAGLALGAGPWAWTAAATAFATAFAAYLFVYVPILTTPRPDGRPG